MGEFDFAYSSFEKVDVLNTGHGTMQVCRAVLRRAQSLRLAAMVGMLIHVYSAGLCLRVGRRSSGTRART